MTLDENGIRKLVKNKITQRVFFIYGSDGFLKQFYCDSLIKAIVGDSMREFNLHIFDDDNYTFDDVIADAQSLPLFAERRCVLAKDCRLIKSVKKKAEEPKDGGQEPDEDGDSSEKEQKEENASAPVIRGVSAEDFGKGLAEIPDTTTVIFYYDNIVPDPKVWAYHIEQVDRYGVSAAINHRTEQNAANLLVSRAASRGTSIDPATALYMTQRCGEDLNVLLGEFNKVCAYANGSPVTREMIDLVVTRSLSANVFEINDSILSGNIDKAYSILGTLLKSKQAPQQILGAMISTYVQMYRAAVARESGERGAIDKIGEAYKLTKGQMFVMQRTAGSYPGIGASKLRLALELLADADTALKTSSAEPDAVFTVLIGKLYSCLKK